MPKGLNSGSCKSLVEYLNKEERGFFFDKNDEKAKPERVQAEIDQAGKKGIRKEDDKFYMLSFSPSKHELSQLVGRKVDDIKNLTYDEKIRLFSDLRSYTHNAMDIYAQNFNRDNVQSGKDLVYFARIETERTYHHFDKEVKAGKVKAGEQKDGLQFHIHVIVSRKSADGKTMLSPNIRFRNKEFTQGNEKMVRGFDYTNFTTKCHDQFSSQFNISYKRNYDYTRDKSVSDNAALQLKSKVTSQLKSTISNGITQGEFSIEKKMLSNSMQAARIMKTAMQLTNPATATKQILQEALNTAQKVHQIALTLMK